ncbi:serine hydrolase domain-containing protein [Senegalia massiliensis]|uniref:serine hydrolase domain-containing protein n=1 Tax=Senegalia massiliensis TaxID=1720316 RepID=UPI00102F556C|nr:serine hydrolase domain-containing protein [Senegalia massiliensis]
MFKEELVRLLNEKSNNNEFSGVVLIKKSDKEIYSGSYGYANRSWCIKNSIETKFRIGSISKMFTAVAIIQLIENEKINFDTSVVKYLELDNTKIPEEVTIHNLLTHTSGIADYFDENGSDYEWEELWSKKPIYSFKKLCDYLQLFAYDEPIYNVGEKFQYNGAGYILLGLIIEKVSGVSYFDYVRKNIFSKLNMNNTDFISLDEVYNNVAEGYEPIESEEDNMVLWKKNIYTATPVPASDGGATSTAYDLISFVQSLRATKILGEDMANKILMPYVLDEGSNGFRDYVWKYGYGNWFILDKDNNVIRCGHTGEEYGVSCRLYYYPSFNIDVVILGNQGWCSGDLGWEIHDMIIKSKL